MIESEAGSRSGSDENPGILGFRGIRPRQRVVEGVGFREASDLSGTPAGVRIQENHGPRVVVATASRPGANFLNPSGIKTLGSTESPHVNPVV